MRGPTACLAAVVAAALAALMARAVGAQPHPYPASPGAPDGNRYVEGRVDLAASPPRRVALPAPPRWVQGNLEQERPVWYVLLETGDVVWIAEAVRVVARGFPPHAPLALDVRDEAVELFGLAAYRGNTLTHPVRVWRSDAIASVGAGGELRLDRGGVARSLDIDALADGRILQWWDGRLLLLTGQSRSYGHGILGDPIEADGFALISTWPRTRVEHRFRLSDGGVFETLAPIWVDLDADGAAEVLLTRSDGLSGAALQVYAENGSLLASGEPVGHAYRWIHPLAAAPFGPNGEVEIAAVKTPHIGGILEFVRLEGPRLALVHARPGFSTHAIGSRILDGAVAVDVDGDGRPEVILPSQDRRVLHAVRRTEDGSDVVASVPLGGRVVTNLAAVAAGGVTALALGIESGELLIW